MHEPAVFEDLLPYSPFLESRTADAIDLAVIHCTELPDLAAARTYGERIHYPESGTGNSGHYYIERNGRIVQWVPHDRVAHHVRGYNARSIGIELVNKGRFPHWLDSRKQSMSEIYPPLQVRSLVSLLLHLHSELPKLVWVAGHEDLDQEPVPASDNPQRLVRRKMDPGPLFPWEEVLSEIPLRRFSRHSPDGSI